MHDDYLLHLTATASGYLVKMLPSAEATLPAMRRTRRSIGAHTDVRKALDKENVTYDVGSSLATSRKKSRSKSMGPGGLDALKQGNGNRRASLAAPIKLPRSILKPTISALPEIPPMKMAAHRAEYSSDGRDSTNSSSSSGGDSSGSKIAVRTEEEQHAAARDREERERRDARRKSLANRRVSFAAEATLHTFHEVEYMQDSITSTDSARRASSAAAKSLSQSSAAVEREEPPKLQVDSVSKSPDNQRELHQRKRRQSSGLPPMNFSSTDDDTIASTIYSSDSEPADGVEEIAEDEDEASSSESDDGTMMTIDTEEVTGTTVASDRSTATGEDSTLDEALRIAAQRAGAQNLGSDDDEDVDDGEEVIPSFGWVKRGNQPGSGPASRQSIAQPPKQDHQVERDNGTETDMNMDMDMTHAVGRIIKPPESYGADEQEGDMSMDVTQAFGGILSHSKASDDGSVSVNQAEAATDEATMEFTTAIGGIRHPQSEDQDEVEEHEDMSMELTTVLGGVLSQTKDKRVAASRRRTFNSQRNAGLDDATMDMTLGVGRIMSAANSESNDAADGEDTMGMDITTTIGGITMSGQASPRTLTRRIMEGELDKPNSPKKATMAAVSQGSPTRRTSRTSQAAAATPFESPGLSAFRGKGLRRSTGPQGQDKPKSGSRSRTPSPAKLTTPRRGPASTSEPSLEAQSHNSRSVSPKRQHPFSARTTTSPEKANRPRASFFQSDPMTGSRTPTVILTPQKRNLSGVGADRTGLGSPQVAALCDRRGSIGESATGFVPGKRMVAFEDPKKMEEDVDKELQDEEGKEDRRKILECETDGSQEDKDATFNLREMIDSLSPKRNLMKSRKSLHVGSAKGLLGKRPAELDEDEDAEDDDGVKRLKGHQSSPVKNIRLQQPPSKAETTGRLTRSARSLQKANRNLAPSFLSPLKNEPAATPRHQGRLKDVGDNHKVTFYEANAGDDVELENEVDEEKIHLQDFLNMTSIRFMELTTTRRRHTVAPGSLQDGTTADGQDALSLDRCVVAGACTVPMLELYQHSCRELKKYISEGRRMVKEIENDTSEENPPLFREYMSATADVKALMDNQFKNVKTHARLLSKAMWYEWRMKLQDGLKEGLVTIAEGMESDHSVLQEQRELLASILPAVVERYEALEEESDNLKEAARELADCDPTELRSAREELTGLDADIADKKRMITELRQQLEESTVDVEALTAKKQGYLKEIEKSEKVREECRGWTSREVNALKARVDAVEKEHGWAVTGLSGTTLSMAYRREIELVFDIASFRPHQPNSRIDLWYIADGREHNPVPKTAEKEFFLQCIRDHIRALPQSRTKLSDLLDVVRAGWDKARQVSSHVNRVNVTFPTTVTKTSDSSIAMTSSLLLVPLETRVEVTLHLHGRSGSAGIDVGLSAEGNVVYGEHFNLEKIGEFLATRIGDRVAADGEDWSDVVVELQQRLIARGKK
ncbi:Kinetochore protein spc7 [Tolypocladium capitatum]|uniref:Kinetochore protein spc7 n=1 Tax=Tolypocladium capitatum TaxID=45235 RepID=A0A2K3PU79_9HYPO|nr:Kinetochore protein spc7 [Tolypocladium capitatum]